MRIVDIELDRAEKILNPVVLDIATIDEVFVFAADDDLPGDGDLVVVLVTQWGPRVGHLNIRWEPTSLAYCFLSLLSNVMETVALVTPACPFL